MEEIIERGKKLFLKGEYQKAEEIFKSAYKNYKQKNMLSEMATSLKYLTDLYLETEQDDIVLDYLLELLQYYQELNQFDKEVQTLSNIGRTYAKLQKIKRGKQYFKKALELSERFNYELGKAYVLFNWGESLRYEGKLEEALVKLNEAGKRFLKLRVYDKSVAVYLSMISIQRLMQNITSSRKTIQLIEDVLKLVPHNRTLANSYINLAIQFQLLEEYKKSLLYLNKALDIGERLNLKGIQAHCHMNIGYIYINLKRNVLAKKYLDKSLKMYKELEDNDGLSKVYNGLGFYNLEKGNLDDAINFIELSLKYTQNNIELEIRNYLLLDDIYKLKRNNLFRFKSLFAVVKKYDQILINIKNPILKQDFYRNIFENIRNLHKIIQVLSDKEIKVNVDELEEIRLIARNNCVQVKKLTGITSQAEYIEITKELISVIEDMKGKYLENDSREIYAKKGFEMEWVKHYKNITEEERQILIKNGCYDGKNPPKQVEIDLFGKKSQLSGITYLIGECRNRKRKVNRNAVKCFIIKAYIVAKYLMEYHEFKDGLSPQFQLIFISTSGFESEINIEKKIKKYWKHPVGRLINKTCDLISYTEFLELMKYHKISTQPYRKLKKVQQKYKL